jgi:hypothetical protein
MKTNKLFLALTALALLACNKKEPEVIVPKTADYQGTVTVMYQGEPYDNENIGVNFTPAEDGKTASITIYKIRFVPQMPVTIDVTIPNVQLTATTTEILLSCDEVIPIAMGGEYPRYKVTNLTGVIKNGAMDFSLNFGDVPTSFTGHQLLK